MKAPGLARSFDAAVPASPPLERPSRSVPGRSRWRTLVASILAVLAVLAISYLVIANVLLRTRLLRDAIGRSPSSFAIAARSTTLRLDYDSAYSILPGRAHVEGLTIRGRERTVEWALTLDRADVAISLTDLLGRRFHATQLRSSGLTMRARLRLDRVHATPEVIAALPPIAGFADPPLLEDGPEPPPPDANDRLWAIDLEDVDVEHVREVWIHTVRAEGDTRVRGRWLFRPQRWLDVGPATVDVNGVDISYGRHPLATGLRGAIEATVHPFDLQRVRGREIFDHVSYAGELSGRAIVADALGLLAPRSGVAFTRWEGPLEAHVILDHGTFADGTRVRSDATGCELEGEGLTFEAPVRTELRVDGDLATIDTRVSGLRVSHLGVGLARVASIAARVTGRHPQLAHGLDEGRIMLDVTGAETSDIGVWRPFLPSTSTYALRSGVVTAGGHAEGSLSGEWVAGTATVTAERVTARLGPALLAGKLATHVVLRRATWEGRTLDLSGSDVVLRPVSAASARSGVAILSVPSLTVVAPRFAVSPAGVDGHIFIDLPRADLADLGGLSDLLPMPSGFAVGGGRGRGRLHADIELGSGAIRGDGVVAARGIRARVGATEFFGDLDCAARVRRTGPAKNATDLSGSTVTVTHAGTGVEARTEDEWWGKATLREATLQTTGGARFDAKVHLTAKDATPATVFVSQNTGIPAWGANVFRMPVLDADAEVRVDRSSFEVRALVARGGDTSLRAEYARRNGRQDGAVLVDLGWIDLGYDLTEGATGLVLIGPEGWFARKTATMRNATAVAGRETEGKEQLALYAGMPPRLRADEARTLAARCAREARACDGMSIENLLRAAADAAERDTLSGIAYAPMVVAAAKRGTDGATLDAVAVGSAAEALKIGGESTLDNIPPTSRLAAASDSDAARGKAIVVTGRPSSIRNEGPYSVGTLTTDAEPVYFVTPFPTRPVPETVAYFRGVFVQRYAPGDQAEGQAPSLVLVGAFGP